MKQNYKLCNIYFLIPVIFFWLLSSCDKPERFETSGTIGFSADSVKFDTLFTTIQSPTERLYIYNRSGKSLRIAKISLAQGNQSPFSMILDGVAGQIHENVEISKGDSIYAFFKLKQKVEEDKNIVDQLIVDMGNEKYSVTIFARVLDAYLIGKGDTVACDTTLTPKKPIVVDGPLIVQKGCTLTIAAGTKLYFTAHRETNYYNFLSGIFVDGTLRVNPEGGEPVLFTNFRLNKDYQEAAGQWQGIILLKNSRGSIINKALIKNGTIGVRVDSLTLPGEVAPKLLLANTEIRNMSNYAILGLGYAAIGNEPPAILAYNVLAYNCGQSVVGMAYGGKYRFYHSTFYNGGAIGIGRSQPVLGFNNYFRNERENKIEIFSSDLVVQNCIIYGTNRDEFSCDIANGGPNLRYAFDISHNLIRTQLSPNSDPTQLKPKELPPGKNNILNQNPNFKDIGKRDYKIQEGSPAINTGLNIDNLIAPEEIKQALLLDFDAKPRPKERPDIGCFEFQ